MGVHLRQSFSSQFLSSHLGLPWLSLTLVANGNESVKIRHTQDRFPGFIYSYVQLSKTFEHKIVIISLPINLNIYFGYSKEPSH